MAETARPQIVLSDALVMQTPPLADWLVVAPLVLGFAFAALCLMTRKNTAGQPALALTGLALMLASKIGLFVHVLTSGTVVMAMGRWLPPFGITFTADMLGATLALATGIVGLAVGIYAVREADNTERRYGFYPFLLMMLAGVACAFLTGDIFNLYVWFEVLLLGSFGLLVLGSRPEQLDGATKYAFLNLVATTLFLVAVAYVYGLFGTLNMADIARKAAEMDQVGPRLTIAALFFFAFAMKVAAFPLNFWLPASYHTPRIAVSAVFAGLLTKVGVYALLRIFMTIFPGDRVDLAVAIGVVAAATMMLGALGALAQTDMRRILGYLVISGIGIMLAGLALGSATGLSGTAFYTVHSMIVMTALYLLVGVVGAKTGTFDLARAGGLYTQMPWLAAIALVLCLSVAGLPPLSGLWPKIYLVKASIDVGVWWLAAAILVSGLVTTIALMRLFTLAFWRPSQFEPGEQGVIGQAGTMGRSAYPILIALTALTVIAGVYPEPFIKVSDRIAFELMQPTGYIDAVFGDGTATTPALTVQ
ncbi:MULTISPECIES: Na+/H+ antiporter subunit D [unclassified Roseitalea]|uniref:Na+/H+ antiporter subunit D n=1 Tax=unclassified Roseitalea TaxID=2639107 RepID=UPI00273F2116|nr:MULTISPECIES: Na+/H+ antiporter subunit D [unclassified Roseitalea]